MLDFLIHCLLPGAREHCPSCRRCLCFAGNHPRAPVFSGIKTIVAQPDPYPMCFYRPTDRGGCDGFRPMIKSRSFIIDSFRDSATPKPGSVVVCDLRLFFLPGVDHSGIVDDGGRILHMDGELGLVRSSPMEFTNRLNGKNGAMSIYVACDGYESIGNEEAFKRGEKALLEDYTFDDYDLFTNNCHQFVQYCLTGRRDASFTFSALESELCQNHGMDNWRKWDVKLYED